MECGRVLHIENKTTVCYPAVFRMCTPLGDWVHLSVLVCPLSPATPRQCTHACPPPPEAAAKLNDVLGNLLVNAAERGDGASVERFLERGADVNYRTVPEHYGRPECLAHTPLLAAAKHDGHVEVASPSLLLDRGASLESTDNMAVVLESRGASPHWQHSPSVCSGARPHRDGGGMADGDEGGFVGGVGRPYARRRRVATWRWWSCC